MMKHVKRVSKIATAQLEIDDWITFVVALLTAIAALLEAKSATTT